ncbi:MAG: SPFH domain-containing protein [Pseudomonadota bacterium]
MFGIRFIKTQPTTYLMQYAKGRLKREGPGLAFFYFAPLTSLVTVPLASVDVPFIFHEVTSDFQEISLQGQVTYRVQTPRRLAELLNYTLNAQGSGYVSDDPQKLPQRLIQLIQVLVRSQLKDRPLRDTLTAGDELVQTVLSGLRASATIEALGLEVMGLSLLAIKPTPETARALEAEVREQLLQRADEALFVRRNAAVEQERAIKENQLNTEIAVENKKRLIREAQMEAERAVQDKQWQMREADMTAKIALEQRNTELVGFAMDNLRRESEAKAHGLAVTMQALAGSDPRVLQALASVGMAPGQLIALAFRDLADQAGKIGQLNVTPDLLRELLSTEQDATRQRK